MKIQRAVLSKHLRRIMCGGQIQEAIFDAGLGVQALTPDQLMLVLAPTIDGTSGLGVDEVGIADLARLQRAAAMVAADGEEEGSAGEIDLSFSEGRLIVDPGPARGLKVSLVTAAPRTIATKIDPKIVEQLTENVGPAVIPITKRMLSDVASAFSGLKAEEVELTVGPKGGTIRVGDEHSDTAELTVPELKTEETYTLTFGKHLIDALNAVTDEAPVLYLSGPNKHVALQDGDYVYILSPRHRSKDKPKRAEATTEGNEAAPVTKKPRMPKKAAAAK